ncbi:MAG: phosphoglucosamine mutase [Vicinamibacterales bacterium]
MTEQRLFGTDGVRGVAGTWPLDPATVARLGAALVRAIPLGRPPRIVVGRDTRESGLWIERELARGAESEGARVTSAGIVPTPAIAYLAGAFDFDLGVVLSASHNPYGDNGIKIFSGRGEKFAETQERAVELAVGDASWQVADSAAPVLDETTRTGAYLDKVQQLLPHAGRLAGARVAVDMANGATTTTAETLLRRVGLEVIATGNVPDGRNINLDCGSTHPAGLARLVVEQKCRLGIAFDGDGDRCILVDAAGNVVDGDAMLLLLALAYQRKQTLTANTVVATVMSNIGLELALAKHGITLLRAPVGDKYVMEEMLRGGFVLGGEQSGHVIMTEHLPTGDGLATALAVLRVMEETGQELSALAAELVTYPQTLLNVRVRERVPVSSIPSVRTAIEDVESALDGQGRVLVRYSGTEPLLRIMIEGQDLGQIQGWAEHIAGAVRSTLA